ncbi:hypothetical protein GX563_12130 [Candidatus Bathyarchaeota archaeon]|nr:hypothetical protein [Candidatus Bathyarchaeota archaeon]
MSEISEEKRETVSVKMKPSLWKDAKKAAIDEGITVSELAEQAIQEWIEKHGKNLISDAEAKAIARQYAKKGN